MKMQTVKLQEFAPQYLKKHVYLEPDDQCFFFGHIYTSNKRYNYSETNQLIKNLKIKRDEAYRRSYYDQAINEVTNYLLSAGVGEQIKNSNKNEFLYVPIPPSKIKSDPRYSNPCAEILQKFQNKKELRDGVRINWAHLIQQTESSEESHKSNETRSPDKYKAIYQLQDLSFTPKKIILFDDVISSGSHFRACSDIIKEKFKNTKVYGLFIARAYNQNFNNN
jgi:predicted amidophosphoribosyltransferase